MMPSFEYGYWPMDRWTSPEDAKARMPQMLRRRLLRPEQYGIFIDSRNTADVLALDAYLKVKRRLFARPKFYRALHVEVNRQELHLFRFYRILPHVWQPGKNLHLDLTATSCDAFVNSIRIDRPAPDQPLLFSLDPMMFSGCVLLASCQLADALKGLTGIDLIPVESAAGTASSRWYALVVTARGAATGDHIVPGDGFDRTAHTVVAPMVAGWRLQDEQIADTDFQAVSDLHVKGTTYHYAAPHMLLSARAVEILLDRGVRHLGRPAWRLNEPFIPIPTMSELHRLKLMP